MSMQVCSNVFDLSTDWNASGAEQLYTVNPASGQITTESRRRALLSSDELHLNSRALLGGATGAAAAANEPVSFKQIIAQDVHASVIALILLDSCRSFPR